jgi:hypothetical protein
MKVFNSTRNKIFLASWVSHHQGEKNQADVAQLQYSTFQPSRDWLQPLRNWLDNIVIADRLLAHRLCKLIPAQCPFERDIKFLGKILFHIPPMCKLNPVYSELVGLRFRALCYLADQCQEDISEYC